MSGLVYYLCFLGERSGFLFPDELPKNYYSPGLFLVTPEEDGTYAFSYTFDAMDNGVRISLNLVRADEANPRSTLYVVRTDSYGSFWFDLRVVNSQFRYIGNRSQISQYRDFSVAVSVDADKLERACKNFNFYFIGRTLRDRDL